jgi:non-ribosomal peptide synthetase component E (peptide arylation enzyme)
MTTSTGDANNDPAGNVAAGIGLDQLFRYAASQRPDALALIDPPDREQVTGGTPRSLTYAQADRAISSIAARLAGLGLATGDIVGLQMPNTVEGVLALLGILRAGLIAAPLPLLWRRADCTAALAMIKASALITHCRVGATDHGDIATKTAAAVSTIRHVGLFGGNRDGAFSFDDGESEPAPDFAPARRNDADPALVTFDVTAK